MNLFRAGFGSRNPSQAARLLWFFALFLTPMAGVAYVSIYEVRNGGREDLVHLLWILAVSLIVSLGSAITLPIQIFNEDGFTKAARANLCLAIVDTIIVALLFYDPSSTGQACHLGAECRTYPVGWLALVGMHYCYAIEAYTIRLIWS